MITRDSTDAGDRVLSTLLSEMVSSNTEVEACELLHERTGPGEYDVLVTALRHHEIPSLRRAALAALLETLDTYGYASHAEVLAMCLLGRRPKPPLLIGG